MLQCLCVRVCVCMYIYTYIGMYMCVYVYTHHIFFIQFSVSGHLGCVHVLAIVNNASMNTGMHVSFQIMSFLQHIYF